MSLSIGIVGLSNTGKSSLFNALTKAQNAQASNYPFSTIEPNKATVPVPDERLGVLSDIVKPKKTIYATVDFIDIAGLVKGASKGEGLGNQFLNNIKACDAILEVIRCFEDDNIAYGYDEIDPLRDIETIETELVLADIQTIERRLERTQKLARHDKNAKLICEEFERLLEHFNQGKPASSYVIKNTDAFMETWREMGLLSAKKIIYCANVDENHLDQNNPKITALKDFVVSRNAELVIICAKIEEEILDLTEEEQKEILSSYGILESGLNQVIQKSYNALDLISYFTAGPKEVRAWTIHKGYKAPQAARVIHSDFERGFIRAEIIAYQDYIRLKTEAACRAVGLLRTEGKEYIVKDADVVHFLFNV